MQKWEYLRVTVVYRGEHGEIHNVIANGEIRIHKDDKANWKDLQNYLDSLGAQGWEMVSINTSNVRTMEFFYFKRPLETK